MTVAVMIVAVRIAAAILRTGFNPDAIGVVGEMSRFTITLGTTPPIVANNPAFRHPRLDLDFFPVAAWRRDDDGWRRSIHHCWRRGVHDGGRMCTDDHRSRMMINRGPDVDANANARIGAS